MKIPNTDSALERSLHALEYQQLPSAHTPTTNTMPRHAPNQAGTAGLQTATADPGPPSAVKARYGPETFRSTLYSSPQGQHGLGW